MRPIAGPNDLRRCNMQDLTYNLVQIGEVRETIRAAQLDKHKSSLQQREQVRVALLRRHGFGRIRMSEMIKNNRDPELGYLLRDQSDLREANIQLQSPLQPAQALCIKVQERSKVSFRQVLGLGSQIHPRGADAKAMHTQQLVVGDGLGIDGDNGAALAIQSFQGVEDGSVVGAVDGDGDDADAGDAVGLFEAEEVVEVGALGAVVVVGLEGEAFLEELLVSCSVAGRFA